MNTESQHLTMDLWYNQDIEPIVDNICKLVDENFTVIKKCEHQFEPQGKTIVYILSESHFTLHTYPEHDYITLDIYICNPNYDMRSIAHQIIGLAEPTDRNVNLVIRGKNV